MSEKVEDKTVELMDRAADAVEAFAVKLGELSTEYGPEVVDAALWIARIDALSILGSTAIIFLIGIFLALNIKKAMAWSIKVEPDWDSPLAIWGYAVAGASLILLFVATVRLFNPWPWVGIIEPQLWIAKRVLGL